MVNISWREVRQKIKKIGKANDFLAVQAVLIILLCFLHSLNAGHYADFYPINGTFQNYNPVRRLLSGQIPYRDFADYLGLGHLLLGSICTFLFGGSYQDSLVAFSFLTIVSLALLSTVLGYAITGSRKAASTCTIFLLCILFIQPLFYTNGLAGTKEIKDALNGALGPGNSARFIRGMVLPVTIAAVICGKKLFDNKNIWDWPARKKNGLVMGAASLIAGISFIWSNDYGISCWLCLIIMAFWIFLSRRRNFIKAIGYSAVLAVLSMTAVAVLVTVFTLGHLPQWISSTFGSGDFQSWYYNSSKSYYLYDVDFSYLMMMQAVSILIYLIKIYQNKGIKKTLRYAAPAFANMASFCAVNEYRLISGGFSREYAFSVFFLTVSFEIVSFLICF